MNVTEIRNVVVVGAGIMGEGIAQNFAQGGLAVRLVDVEKRLLDKCLAQIEANLKLFMEFGLLHEKPSTVVSRIKPYLTQDINQATRDCNFIVEAIPEILDAKKELFARLDSLPEAVIVSSNTSSFTITAISDGIKTPQRVVGLHYFNPAHIMPAVEIHRGKHTTDEVVETTRELMLRVGKKPALVKKELPGFIINRLTGAMEREIDYLLEEGVVSPEDLDTAVKGSFGFRLACLGPMEAEDMIGLDTASRVGAQIYKVLSNSTEPSPLLLAKVQKGELGIKSGRGWYDYTGMTREEVMAVRNRILLQQLALFQAREKESS